MEVESITPKPIKVREGNTDADILREARERATMANMAWQPTFDSAEDDELFISGIQWDSASLKQRDEEQRPSLVVNQLQQYV